MSCVNICSFGTTSVRGKYVDVENMEGRGDNERNNVELEDFEVGENEISGNVHVTKKKYTARKRVMNENQGKNIDKGKVRVVVQELEEEEDSDEEYEEEYGNSEEEYESDEERRDCSDSELSELRKVRADIRKENEALEKNRASL